MSALAKTTAVPKASDPAKSEGKPGGKKRGKPTKTTLDYSSENQGAEIVDLFTGQTLPPFFAACESLARAMSRGTGRPLPKQGKLEQHFDASLAQYSAVWSSEISNLLKSIGAEAAVLGKTMALKSADTSFETLKHETAHLLQMSSATGGQDFSAAEAEAEHSDGAVEVGLDADVLAFRASDLAEDEQTDWEASQEFRAQANASEPQVDPEQTPEPAAEDEAAQDSVSTLGGAFDDVDLDEEGDTQAASIESELPPLSAEAEAAKAALEETTAALDAAATPDAYMAAFKAAPPSLKAQKEPTLAQDMARLSAQENAAFEDSTPEFSATLYADETDVPEVAPIDTTAREIGPLEEGTPEPVPDPVIAPTQELAAYNANGFLGNWAPPMAESVDARQVAGAIGRVQVVDEEVETSPGPAPAVPLEGEADPERAREQAAAASEQATDEQAAATLAVVDGPGPELVQLRAMDEAVPLEMDERAMVLETAPVEGPDEFLSRELDAEATAIFDAHHGTAMESSLADAEAEMEAMVSERDTQRDAATTQAEADMQTAQAQANAEQAQQVGDARQSIQDERVATLDAQGAAVEALNAEAETENRATQIQIQERVAADEAEVSAQYAAAESEAEAELASAQAEATREREAAEDAAESDSWWDAAVDWVGEQLSKLGDLIGDIFDALRAGIGAILDAVKDIAFAIIDAAADFVKGAIALYGELLKLAVTNLIGSVFPELAQALNAAIDAGVAAAQAAVDAVAEGLKALVEFVVEAYKAALTAILNFVEGALNTVLAVMRAALSGDWGEVARLIIEPILAALGINKDDFYAFVGSAVESFGKIIDDPIAFLGHLMGAVVGGFRKFGENFVDHLISGIIGWLTGAFAGTITLPQQFDLLGVLDIARQILGLTLDTLRRIAVRIVGEAAVEKIEFFIGYAAELITNGWGAFFEKIKDDLGGLVNMVMGEITTFLLERVVKAGIVWLASLINPAGALVKIVLMIWDAIMWLKDNLGRFVRIIQTVVQGMIDIANGRTENASLAIEQVLKGLLAPTIDLIARLIGLGNVAGKVKKIISNIHKKIEDAAVKFIRKILARFTGRGGSADGTDDAAEAGDLMRPVQFSGGGESHTLYAEEHGEDVVPFMRSTPTPVDVWLNGLKTDAGVKVQLLKNDADVTDEAVSDKKDEIAQLVATALQEEDQMDVEGEQAQDAVQAAPDQAQADKAELEQAAREVAAALTLILEALGLTDAPDFKEHFDEEIAATNSAAHGALTTTINSRINGDLAKKVAYTSLQWSEVKALIPNDASVLTLAWDRPYLSTGFLREDDKFHKALIEAATKYAEDHSADLNGVDHETFLSSSESQTAFMTRHFLPQINNAGSRQKAFDWLLGRQAAVEAIVPDLADEITAALTTFTQPSAAKKPDVQFKDNVKAASFREGGIFETKEFLTLRMTYFAEQDASGAGVESTKLGEQKDLNWFLNRVPVGSPNGSSRAQENVTHMANMIRDANPGNHEWILASQANEAIAASVSQLEAHGGTESAEGVANFVAYLHKVRTNTSDLVFEPAYANRINSKELKYLSREHLGLLGRVNQNDAESQAALAAAYAGQPQMGATVFALQAHSGGLQALQLDPAGQSVVSVPSSSASTTWHNELREEMSGILSRAVDIDAMNELSDAIFRTLERTTLSETSEAAPLNAEGFEFGHGLYQFTGSGALSTLSFDSAIAESVRRHGKAAEELMEKIKEILPDYNGAIPT